MKTLRNLFLLAVFAALFAVPAAVRAADAAKPALTSKDANATYQSDNYKLRPTDSIAINVVDDPNATHTYSISIDGTVQLIYLDTAPPLKLADLTVEQAKKAVIKAYVDNKIFIHPSITIDVTAYSTRRINVTWPGGQARPGLYSGGKRHDAGGGHHGGRRPDGKGGGHVQHHSRPPGWQQNGA